LNLSQHFDFCQSPGRKYTTTCPSSRRSVYRPADLPKCGRCRKLLRLRLRRHKQFEWCAGMDARRNRHGPHGCSRMFSLGILTRGFDDRIFWCGFCSRFGIVEEFPCLRILAHAFSLTKPRCIVIHPHYPNNTRISGSQRDRIHSATNGARFRRACEKPEQSVALWGLTENPVQPMAESYRQRIEASTSLRLA